MQKEKQCCTLKEEPLILFNKRALERYIISKTAHCLGLYFEESSTQASIDDRILRLANHNQNDMPILVDYKNSMQFYSFQSLSPYENGLTFVNFMES